MVNNKWGIIGMILFDVELNGIIAALEAPTKGADDCISHVGMKFGTCDAVRYMYQRALCFSYESGSMAAWNLQMLGEWNVQVQVVANLTHEAAPQ